MRTLEDVLIELDKMDVSPDEIKISRAAYNYFIKKARDIVAAEEAEGDEEE